MAQFYKRSELLRPVAGNAAADGKNPQAFLSQESRSKMLEVFEWIEADFVAAGAFALLLVAIRSRAVLREQIPLGPFLAGGAIAAVLLSAPGALG